MSRREAWLSAGLVFVVALVVRAWAASQITFPRPEDTAYYVSVARNLLEGHGLTIDVVWSYATPPLILPRPAFEVWLPVPSFLMAIPMGLFGHTFAAAQVASVLEGSAVAALAWWLAAEVAKERELTASRARWLALGAGLAAAVYLPLVLASAQPDSTMPFAMLVLLATLVARRILGGVAIPIAASTLPRLRFSRRAPRRGSPPVLERAPGLPRVVVERRQVPLLALLGVLFGLAALTRNDAIWLALAWAILAWRVAAGVGTFGLRARVWLPLVAIPALVSIAVYAPWALRDWAVFGTPLPGQALSNALFLKGDDIFAWASPPTLDRYLAAGLPTLIGQRIEALLHDFGNDLLLLGIPISAIGLLAVPWTARTRTLRLLVAFSVLSFTITTLLFPVATLAGTFLHGAGAIQVLVVISAVVALDALIERLRAAMSWTNPVAWIGAAAAVAGSALLAFSLVAQDGDAARATGETYAQLPGALAAAGAPLPTDGSPVISDHPIWLATQDGVRAISLPDEFPADVLDLANHFGAKMLIVEAANGGQWPEILDSEEPGAECFRRVPLQVPDTSPLASLEVFKIVCYGPAVHGTP